MALPRTIRIDASELREVGQNYRVAKPTIDLALMRAMNRGGDQAMTATRKELVKTTGIGAADTRRSRGITRKPATKADLTYEIRVRSQWTPLSYFRPTKAPGGVSASPWNKRQTFAGTFLITFKSGYTGVFRRDRTQPRSFAVARKGKPYRVQPIIQLWGPSLAVETMRGSVPDVFSTVSRQKVAERLPHELTFALSGLQPKRRQGRTP